MDVLDILTVKSAILHARKRTDIRCIVSTSTYNLRFKKKNANKVKPDLGRNFMILMMCTDTNESFVTKRCEYFNHSAGQVTKILFPSFFDL